MHYKRWHRGGTTQCRSTPKWEPQQFLRAAVDPGHDECVPWPYGKHGKGYGAVWFGGSMIGAHVAVCSLVHGPKPSPSHEVAHSCAGRRDCVSGRHVRWALHAANEEDKELHGTRLRGSDVPTAKLDEAAVRDIRARLRAGETQASIAAVYSVHKMTVSNIHLGKTWKWLDG